MEVIKSEYLQPRILKGTLLNIEDLHLIICILDFVTKKIAQEAG